MKRSRLLALLVSCICGLSISTAFAANAVDTVKIETGQLKGAISNGVVSFKGVPFAAPPVNDLRWRAPQPVAPWKGVRSAVDYSNDCMQLPFPSDAAPLGKGVSEDCLYLNVWAPANRTSQKLPVMVWIYGGGFVNGGTSPAVYDGSKFAEHGLVFVSMNYRLGRFGFFAHPALSKEHPEEAKGNYGYMDQIAALKWVQKNISAFGGDPNNVTIFGESAGGGSVMTLLTSPVSRGLFHRAIVQSGGGRDLLMGPRFLDKPSDDGRPSAEETGVAFAKTLGIEGTDAAALAALRKAAPDKIIAGLNLASMQQGATTYTGPIVDGKIVLGTPQQAMTSGNWAKVPVMIGANSADIGFPRAHTIEDVLAPFGASAQKAKAAFDPENSGNAMLVGYRIASDQMMIEPARFVARTVAAQGIPSYEYRFSYVADSIRAKERMGALHASEIPYVFDTVKAKYGAQLTDADEKIAQQANAYWANFAKTGNPDGPGLPPWPAYDASKDVIMDFTMKGPVSAPDAWKDRLDLVEQLAEKRPPEQESKKPAELGR